MRIVGGAWRGRRLVSPPGQTTRPTADRVRQALFDSLLHAPWGGAEAISGVWAVDGFAGTGALGLEALSRGAAHATFMETDPAALQALRANISALGAETRSTVVAADVRHCPTGRPARLIFLDPPYGQDLLQQAFAALRARNWISDGALVIGELGRAERPPGLGEVVSDRAHGAARLVVWRAVREPPAASADQAGSPARSASTPAQK